MSKLAAAPRIDEASGRARAANGVVRRTALVNRLRAAWSHPVATIVAPIGYGKSTLLEQWAARDERTFVRAGLGPNVDELGAELAAGPTVLVFEDTHLLSPEALAAVRPLVRLAGRGSMVVLAGRTEPTIPNLSIAGLRARGELLELGPADLAFTWRETRMAAQAVGATLNDAGITKVFEETEGWPVAVGLAASSLGYQGLRAACLATLSPEQRILLRRTAILERFDRDVCDAVLGYAPGERELQSIDELGAFLVPLDHRRRWFRYHRLLRAALREELQRQEPELVPLLHERAADWFEAQGDAERAMEHSYAAGDIPRFMRIFSAAALSAHNGGRDAAVERWIGRIGGAGTLDAFPDAAALAARLYAHRGHSESAARCLDAADRGLANSGPADDGSAAAARTSLVHAATDSPTPQTMQSAVEKALRQLTPDDPWWPYGLLLGGVASLLVEELERADELFGRAARAAARLGSTETQALAIAERALLAEARGEPATADAHLRRIPAVGDHLDGFASYALALAASARVLLRRGLWAEARQALGSAHGLARGLTEALPWLAVQARLELARAWVMLRDPAAARLLLDEADRILAVQDLGVLRRQRDALAIEIDAMPATAPGRTVRLTAAELRLLPLLATHLSFREIGEHLFLSRHTVKTQAISAYRKLGASNRSEAVQQAEQLGLIEAA